MKLAIAIFSMYILALTIVPCCSFDNCEEKKAVTAKMNGHDRGDDDGCGSCSPFFSCEGCAAVSIVYEPLQFDFTLPANSPVYTTYQHTLLSKTDLDFWQPPKIG